MAIIFFGVYPYFLHTDSEVSESISSFLENVSFLLTSVAKSPSVRTDRKVIGIEDCFPFLKLRNVIKAPDFPIVYLPGRI